MAKTPAWKVAALADARDQWYELHDDGYKIEMLTDYHWKYKDVNIWPSSKKYQRKGEKVKHYQDLIELITTLWNQPPKPLAHYAT